MRSAPRSSRAARRAIALERSLRTVATTRSRAARQLRREEREQLERRRVGPVQVVEQHATGASLRRVEQEPAHAVEHPEAIVLALRARVGRRRASAGVERAPCARAALRRPRPARAARARPRAGPGSTARRPARPDPRPSARSRSRTPRCGRARRAAPRRSGSCRCRLRRRSRQMPPSPASACASRPSSRCHHLAAAHERQRARDALRDAGTGSSRSEPHLHVRDQAVAAARHGLDRRPLAALLPEHAPRVADGPGHRALVHVLAAPTARRAARPWSPPGRGARAGSRSRSNTLGCSESSTPPRVSV